MPQKYALDVEPFVVGDFFAVLDVALENPQVHRPAVAGDAVMLVQPRPAGVMKAHLGSTRDRRELKAYPRSFTIIVGFRQLQLELLERPVFGDTADPVVLWSKPERIVRTALGGPGRALGPPLRETWSRADGVEDRRRRCKDREIVQDVRQEPESSNRPESRAARTGRWAARSAACAPRCSSRPRADLWSPRPRETAARRCGSGFRTVSARRPR